MFTELEKKILDATDPKYKYIVRDGYGDLYLSINETMRIGEIANFCMFNSLFKDAKISGESIRFRKQILDDAERDYLKFVFKPFRNRIKFVVKDDLYEGDCFIWAYIGNGGNENLEFPAFDGKKMYTGMKIKRHYTLKELGITYDN